MNFILVQHLEVAGGRNGPNNVCVYEEMNKEKKHLEVKEKKMSKKY
jgi:hypothetical protein